VIQLEVGRERTSQQPTNQTGTSFPSADCPTGGQTEDIPEWVESQQVYTQHGANHNMSLASLISPVVVVLF
jgi:hypothetical protein